MPDLLPVDVSAQSTIPALDVASVLVIDGADGKSVKRVDGSPLLASAERAALARAEGESPLGTENRLVAAEQFDEAVEQLEGEVEGVGQNLSAHTGSTSNPHSTTKNQVGLGNCDDTADLAKPVSTAQRAAIDAAAAQAVSDAGAAAAAMVAAEASARAAADDEWSALLDPQQFSGDAGSNPWTDGDLTPRLIGDVAVNTSVAEWWLSTDILASAASWMRIASAAELLAGLAAKADLSGGKLLASQLPAAATRSVVDGFIIAGTFGDSTANALPSQGDTLVGKLLVPFPTDTELTNVVFSRYNTLAGMGYILLIANGGWDSQGTEAMLNRSKNAYSATRKAISDIAAARPHIILLHGGSINDIGSATEYSSSLVAAVIERHRQIVYAGTSYGTHYLDSGIGGYDVDGPYRAIRRQMLLEINAGIKAAAAGNPYWHFIEPSGLLHDGTGAFISGLVQADGVHPSDLGRYRLGLAEKSIVDSLFVATMPSGLIYDFHCDWMNASATVPAKIARDFGAATINSTATEAGLYKVNFTSSAAVAPYLIVTSTNLKTILSGAVSGESFAVATQSWVETEAGALVPDVTHTVLLRLYNADNTKSVAFSFRSHNSGLPLLGTFTLPIDAASLGSSSFFQIQTTVPTSGTDIYKCQPPRFYKI